jgi:Pentapeptide repeats (9 copies)
VFPVAKGKSKMGKLEFDISKECYVLTSENLRYEVDPYNFTYALREYMQRGSLDLLDIIDLSADYWQSIMTYPDFIDSFKEIDHSLRSLILEGHVFESGEHYADDDLSFITVSDKIFSGVRFTNVNFASMTFSGCNFSYAEFEHCHFDSTTMFEVCDMGGVDFHEVELSGDNFTDCTRLNLSGASNYASKSDWMNDHLEKTKFGYIVYKSFGYMYKPNPKWVIEENSVITEIVQYDNEAACSYGINVATAYTIDEYTNYHADIWKCLLHFEDLVDTVVPNRTTGKFRVGRLQLLEKISAEALYSEPGYAKG